MPVFVGLCPVFVWFAVSNFSRPYLLTCHAGSTDYINAVFIDVSLSYYHLFISSFIVFLFIIGGLPSRQIRMIGSVIQPNMNRILSSCFDVMLLSS